MAEPFACMPISARVIPRSSACHDVSALPGHPAERPRAEVTRFERYVAIGDSSTEGWIDPDERGGFRGWADRLADHVARAQGELLYANLGIRGKRTRQILDEQLPVALAMHPDLVTVFSGTNDVLTRGFDAAQLGRDVETIHRALIASGATLLTFTLPDLTPLMPLGRLIASRIRALNTALRSVAQRTGALLVDFAAHPVASDARLWNDDRLHANALGHARIAAALAHALQIPGMDASWSEPLPLAAPRTPGERLLGELRWARLHLVPWMWRHALGGAPPAAAGPKRPRLAPVNHVY
jgi:lysophospholipase L1-like esterase